MVILTHNDFDGVTSAIIGKVCFPEAKVEFCNYDNINEKVKEYLDKDVIYIVDISVNEEVAEIIDKLNNKWFLIRLFDHHKTAKWLTKYSWVVFDINKCGAKIFYDWLLNTVFYNCNLKLYEDLVDFTDDYDRWIHNYPLSKKLNTLVYIYGLERFMNRFLENPDCELNETELLLLELEEERKQEYLEEMKDNMVTYKDKQGRNVAVFLSTKYAGEIKAYINDPSIDYYMFFNLSKGVVSIRGKDVVDCSEVAKQFGGGGHRGAAGFQFKFDLDKFVEQFGLYKG